MKQSDNLDEPINRWIVTALDELGTDAINTTTGDLLRLDHLAASGKLPKEIRCNYLATMIEPAAGNSFGVKPYVIRRLEASPGQDEMRVGILAISPVPASASLPAIKTTPPEEALKRYLPEVEAQSDLIVLMTRMPDSDLSRLAQMFPAVDVIVNGSPGGEGRELGKAGNTVIVESAHGGVSQGVLLVEWDAKGHITKYRNQLIPLPPMVPDAPQITFLLERVRKDIAAIMEKEARNSPPVTVPSLFAGVEACKDCHEKAFKAWQKSAHARATEPLKHASQQFNPECLQCHVTGFGVERGFVNVVRTPNLVNVQCEACHSSSVDHSKHPQNVHPGIGMMQQFRKKVSESFCLRCHTAEQSPKFKFAEYWPKIAH